MDTTPAIDWEPPQNWHRLVTIESHTGGEPFRVVIEGLPEIPGRTVLERRRYAIDNLDWLRQATMLEPRGHADMYGGWPGPPASEDGDLSILFTHNEGFSTMCGHGIIALSKVVIETGMVPATGPETALAIDTPAGRIDSVSSVTEGRVNSTRFRNVASFAPVLDGGVLVDGLGEVRYDLAFGGAFYVFVDATPLGVSLDDAATLIDAGRRIKKAVVANQEIVHPDDPDLAFLYGVIFTGPPEGRDAHSRNVCVFADGEIDRSPTGTGVSARLALLHARGESLSEGDFVVESIVGSRFTGRIAAVTTVGSHPAVIPEVEGSAHITGRNEIWIDPEDALGSGFFLR